MIHQFKDVLLIFRFEISPEFVKFECRYRDIWVERLNCLLDRLRIRVQVGRKWVASNKSEDLTFLYGINELLTLIGWLPQDC